jgi:voltage-gated potassium channel Kch
MAPFSGRMDKARCTNYKERRLTRPDRKAPRIGTETTVAVAGTLGLGVTGYLDYDAKAYNLDDSVGWLHRFWSALYESLQLFVLHTPEFQTLPGFDLEAAQALGAFVFFFSIIGAFWRIGVMEYRHLWYSWRRGHIVICGAGWRGLAFARDFYAGRLPVKTDRKGRPDLLVLERDGDSAGIAECERLGIPYLIGDASDPRTLRSVGVHNAATLIAVCGSDEANLEIVIRAGQLKRRRNARTLKCYVNLTNDDLRTMVRQKGFAQPEGQSIEISTFGTDIYENTARRLFLSNPLDRVPIGETSPLRVHLLIVGFSPMGEALLAQAARIGHFANDLPMKVTVIDPRAVQKGEAFATRYRGIDEVVKVRYEDRPPHDAAVVSLINEASQEPNFLPICLICFSDEKLNLALAVKIADAMKDRSMPILWWLPKHSDVGLGLLFSQKLQQELFGKNVLPFGTLENVYNAESLEMKEPDEMGRAFHECYVKEQMEKGQTLANNSSLQPWDALPENFKNSNRLVADHIAVKMRAIGYHLERSPSKTEAITEFSEEETRILSRMEHARYCAERFMDGWCLGEKNAARKTNPTLLPWNILPDAEKVKDAEQVRKVPYIIQQAGWSICR